MKRYVFLLLALLISGFLTAFAVAEVETEVINFEVTPQNPLKGEAVTIYGQAHPNENITIRISFEKIVEVEGNQYAFFVPKICIPEVENQFTVTAEGCDDLKVSVKDYAERYPHWVTISSEASSGVAEVSQVDIPAVIYDVLIHGSSSKESVRLTTTAEGYVTTDDTGRFSYSYDTSSVPTGKFVVQAGDKHETMYLHLPTLPTPSPRVFKKAMQSSGVSELFQLLLVLLAFIVPLVLLAWKKRN